MLRKIFLGLFLAITCVAAFGQLSAERLAVSRMQKGKWKAAEESLRKSLHKDTLNPEAKFTFSRFYFSPANPAYQIDSAYRYINLALQAYAITPAREKERLRRYPIDSTILITYRKKIDSAGFEIAKKGNTERAYQDFLSHFPYADEGPSAIELRNEVAFVDALKVNTWQGILDYISRYPESTRASEARTRYEKLLYDAKTGDGKLESFQSFVKQYPASPHRRQAEKNIFELLTAAGTPESFSTFIAQNPHSAFRARAQVILYHLSREEDLNFSMPLTDSLKMVRQEEQGYWAPVLRNGKFGFINRNGEDMISPRFDKILPEYICGNVREDYLVVGEGIISRSGHWIFQGPVRQVRDLGSGFLKLEQDSCVHILHKSGFALPGDCYEDGKVIGHNFMAVREKGLWGIISLAGRFLLKPQCDDIAFVDGLVILGMNSKKTIVTIAQLASLAEGNALPGALVFDEVQRIAFGNYRVRNGALEGVLDEWLHFIVPLDRQGIKKVPKGFQLEKNNLYTLLGVADKVARTEYSQVQFYGNWIRLQRPGKLQLYDWNSGTFLEDQSDSIWFENKLAFVRQRDSLRVYLGSGSRLDFPSDTKVHFMRSADSTEYFIVPEKPRLIRGKPTPKSNKAVFNANTGERLFAHEMDDAEYIGGGAFMIVQGGKRGLLNSAGKVLLPVEYSAIVPLAHGIFSLLKEKKFGAYQLLTKKLLKPEYGRNISPITSQWLAAYRDEGYGLIGWDGKPLGKFEFEEIQPWNDTSVLAKRDFQWMVVEALSGRVLRSKMSDYTFITDSPQEKLAIVHQDLRYGVISNRRGEIIPPNFSDVVNVGSAEEPLYFAEKSVEEAGIYVVIYYDRNGKLLRKQVYEESEYERIYCTEDN